MNAQNLERLKELLNSTYLPWIGLIVALVVMAAVFHWIRSWYRDGDDPADDADQILRQMRDLHREGDLSEEEFRSIKSQFEK